MKYRAFFEVPKDLFAKHARGSSPALLKRLISELEGATEIKASFFLYNNSTLHGSFAKLASNGCKVTVYSIPLSGYSDNKVRVEGYRNRKSKRDFAEEVYADAQISPFFDLRIFPHTYVWSQTEFNRGLFVYSLHAKCLLATFQDGRAKCVLSSSNFACADQPHSENMLIIEEHEPTIQAYMQYFSALDANSVGLGGYQEFIKSYVHDAYFKMVSKTDIVPARDCLFTAPFLSYQTEGKSVGSNAWLREKTLEFIDKATKRIYICAQHINDYRPYGAEGSQGIVELIRELALKRGIEVKLLKQTTSEKQVQGKRANQVEAALKGIPNVQQRYWSPIIHDKFIIVDESVLVTTANITPSQFAWDDEREMEYEIEGEPHKVKNCFSEVNAFQFIQNSDLTKQYAQHFQHLWEKANAI